MKAYVLHQYGGPEVLKTEEIPKPKLNKGQVLVRVQASSINPIDFKMRAGGLRLAQLGRRPIIPGHDFAGEVAEVSSSRRGFSLGERVFGMSPFPHMGANAEFLAVSEDYLTRQPKELDEVQAAAVPLAALTALQSLRDQGRLQAGQSVLINGASGGVGTFAVQIAKAMRARVTGVCSGKNVELVRSLGADEVINYQQEDFTRRDHHFDLVFDAVGKSSFSQSRRILTPRGNYVSTLPGPGVFAWSALSPFMRQSVKPVWVKPNPQDLNVLSNYLSSGLLRPVVEQVYDYHQLPQAHRDAEAEHTVGKRVVRMNFYEAS
ncbi:MAG: NAD(P)-dependent alcohol dehydrogenase [Cyclobacteriaceae bacterium]